jgi:hypothetical protein
MNEQPSTNKGVIFVVVCTLAINLSIGFSTLSYCLINKIEPNQVLLTSFISITTGLIGWLGGVLSKTSPTEATKAPPPIPTDGVTVGGPPAKVEVVNTPAAPVQTEEVK